MDERLRQSQLYKDNCKGLPNVNYTYYSILTGVTAQDGPTFGYVCIAWKRNLEKEAKDFAQYRTYDYSFACCHPVDAKNFSKKDAIFLCNQRLLKKPREYRFPQYQSYMPNTDITSFQILSKFMGSGDVKWLTNAYTEYNEAHLGILSSEEMLELIQRRYILCQN